MVLLTVTNKIISLPECGLCANLCQVRKRFLADVDPLSLRSDLDDLQTTAALARHAQKRSLTIRKL